MMCGALVILAVDMLAECAGEGEKVELLALGVGTMFSNVIELHNLWCLVASCQRL
jgi:hypothetical protein